MKAAMKVKARHIRKVKILQKIRKIKLKQIKTLHHLLKKENSCCSSQKSKQIRSNKQALSEIAQNLKSFFEAQNKRHQKTLDEERRREERFLEFKREEAEKDRQHELRLAQMLLANMYHARAFIFQPETSQQIVSASNQSFYTSVFPRQ